MDEKSSKETTEHDLPAQVQEKGKQTGLLIVLLLLLGGFGYLYFFTGLIRPQEAPPAPQPPPQVVKQPLPARDAASVTEVKPTVAAPQKTSETKAGVVPPVKPEPKKVVASAKPATQPVSAKVAVVPAVAKPVVATKVEPKKVAPAKAEEKQAAVAQGVQAKKTEPARKKGAAAKPGGPWTVVAGLYVVEETLAADLSKVKKTGLTPLLTTGPKRPVTMHRLFYKEFNTREEAQQAVELMRRTAGSGFTIQRGNKYEVFVGSYAVLSGAQEEQQRLSAAGIKVEIRKNQVPLASRKLTVGTFTDRKAANDALKKLKAAGIGSPVLE
jgi:cytoskeletal protein RodZ